MKKARKMGVFQTKKVLSKSEPLQICVAFLAAQTQNDGCRDAGTVNDRPGDPLYAQERARTLRVRTVRRHANNIKVVFRPAP